MTDIFLNIDKYKKNNNFKQFIYDTIDFSKISDDSTSFNNVLKNKNNKLNGFEEENNNYSEDYSEDYLNTEILDNINIDSILNEKLNSKLDTNSNTSYVKYNEQISDEIKLEASCDKPNYETDTCQDICNDTYYYLRRLQRFDTRLFKFKATGKYKSLYSKKCQSSQERQPIVLESDPEKNPKIKKESYTYSIKYGSDENHQFYYICPKVWCPTCKIPIKYDDLKKFEQRRGKKGSLCKVGKCPFGNHDAFVRENEYYSGTKDNKGGYPGFIDSTGHPDALCMPCCFAKPHNNPGTAKYKTYLKCLGEEYSAISDDPNQIYILGKGFPIDENRYAILPLDINKLFENECLTGYLKEGTSCYVRKGLNYLENRKQSFLIVIADLMSEDKKNPLKLKQLKEFLVQNITFELFLSLNNGLLNLKFDDPLNDLSSFDNYKKYILSDQLIREEFIWDLLSRPNILRKEGINIVIMDFTRIICPSMYGLTDMYDINRPTYFIIKNSNLYEPIYKIENKKTGIMYACYFSGLNKVVSTVINSLSSNCNFITYNWEYKLLENEKLYNIKYDKTDKKEFNLINTLKILKILKINVKEQILDYYNKVIGIITNTDLYIPCLPSGLNINIKFRIKYPDQNYKKIIKKYETISKKSELNLNVKYKIIDNNNIIAVVLENGNIINIKPITNKKDKIKISNRNYYKDLDEVISKNIKYEDGRSINVKKYEYEEESYNRLKYLLARKLNKNINIEIRQKILKYINNDNIEKIIKIISKIFKNKIYESKKVDLKDYKVPNQRILCNSLTKCTDPHCIKIKNDCFLN